jgi:hypothetical protein
MTTKKSESKSILTAKIHIAAVFIICGIANLHEFVVIERITTEGQYPRDHGPTIIESGERVLRLEEFRYKDGRLARFRAVVYTQDQPDFQMIYNWNTVRGSGAGRRVFELCSFGDTE